MKTAVNRIQDCIEIDVTRVHEIFREFLEKCQKTSNAASRALKLCHRGLQIKDPEKLKKCSQEIITNFAGWQDLDGRRLKHELKMAIGIDPYGHTSRRKQREQQSSELLDQIDIGLVKGLLKEFLDYNERESPRIFLGKEIIREALQLSDDQRQEWQSKVLSILKCFSAARGQKVTAMKKKLRKIFGLR